MVITEAYRTRSDGVKLVRTYSDIGMKLIRNDGVVYDEAIDVENSGYTYTESNEYTESAMLSAEEALEIIVGGASDANN